MIEHLRTTDEVETGFIAGRSYKTDVSAVVTKKKDIDSPFGREAEAMPRFENALCLAVCPLVDRGKHLGDCGFRRPFVHGNTTRDSVPCKSQRLLWVHLVGIKRIKHDIRGRFQTSRTSVFSSECVPWPLIVKPNNNTANAVTRLIPAFRFDSLFTA